MYLNSEIQKEINYFRRMNEHFTINAGKKTVKVEQADEKILFMALSASLSMDLTEDGFFDEFYITDKAITGNAEMLLDAYAFIDSENKNEKHLHLFQYKLHETESHSVSPVELINFATVMNNTFVHPELSEYSESMNPIFRLIKQKIDTYTQQRGRKVVVYCHFINNATGISKSNAATINELLGRFEFDKQHRLFDIQILGIKEILELALDGKIRVGRESIDFVIEGQNAYRYEDNSNRVSYGLPRGVFIGICNVNEFIRLQNKYHHNQLYSENIRLYLGDRQAVNKDIIQTITNIESIWFPYMNNGISIICDKFSLGIANQSKKTISIEIDNMQIINGCQTVNALYSAKYSEATKDNFRASNILVRIYEINPSLTDFKMNVIKATNNQNAVKTYSLLANEPIQIKIQEILSKLDYLYDRKGEARRTDNKRVISMPNGALAIKAVYRFEAQSLRSRIGQSRVFQKDEYERIYPTDALDETSKLYILSVKLLVATIILDGVRAQITLKNEIYAHRLTIFKKSAYYLSGYLYALNKNFFDSKIIELTDLLNEDNLHKIRSKNIPDDLIKSVEQLFDNCVEKFIVFYDNVDMDKTDIDNILKSNKFGEKYKADIKNIIGADFSEEKE